MPNSSGPAGDRSLRRTDLPFSPIRPGAGVALRCPRQPWRAPIERGPRRSLRRRLHPWGRSERDFCRTPQTPRSSESRDRIWRILKIGIPYFLGDKVLSALIGLLFFPALNLMLTALGHGLSWGIPTILSIAVAGVLFITPDIDVRKKAAAAREEFSRSLGAYHRVRGTQPHRRRRCCAEPRNVQLPLEIPGSSDGFDEELMRAQRSGQAPWDTLTRISGELELPDLADLADIMTLTGEQGASVAVTLSARASALRNAQLSDELGKAGSATGEDPSTACRPRNHFHGNAIYPCSVQHCSRFIAMATLQLPTEGRNRDQNANAPPAHTHSTSSTCHHPRDNLQTPSFCPSEKKFYSDGHSGTRTAPLLQ